MSGIELTKKWILVIFRLWVVFPLKGSDLEGGLVLWPVIPIVEIILNMACGHNAIAEF